MLEAGWVNSSSSLVYDRYYHVSWRSASGLALAGGLGSGALTSEVISEDGTSEEAFNMRNRTVSACAIGLQASFFLTGGFDISDSVTEYDMTGYLRDLPDLITGRHDHACSFYLGGDGKEVGERLRVGQ